MCVVRGSDACEGHWGLRGLFCSKKGKGGAIFLLWSPNFTEKLKGGGPGLGVLPGPGGGGLCPWSMGVLAMLGCGVKQGRGQSVCGCGLASRSCPHVLPCGPHTWSKFMWVHSMAAILFILVQNSISIYSLFLHLYNAICDMIKLFGLDVV